MTNRSTHINQPPPTPPHPPSDSIDFVYKALTRSRSHPLGGTAYLTVDNEEEPYLVGCRVLSLSGARVAGRGCRQAGRWRGQAAGCYSLAPNRLQLTH